MSINKITTPPVPSFVFVPNWYNFSSSNSGQTNFSMVYNVFNNATGTGSPISDDRPSPRPDGSSPFSPSRILESYITMDKFPFLTGSTGGLNSYINYTIAVGEQYGSALTGVTSYTGITFQTGVTLNGTLQYKDIPSWNTDFSKLIMTGTSGQFLTNSKILIPGLGEVRGVRARDTDWFSLSFFNDIREGNLPQSFKITRITNSGATLVNQQYLPTATGSTAWVQHIGVGPENINNTSQSNSFVGTSKINTETDKYYAISLGFENSQFQSTSACSETFYVLCDNVCTRYPIRHFIFRNGKGQLEHMDFNLVSQGRTDVTRTQWQKVLDFNYSIGDRGVSISDINAQDVWIINTDWITESENVQVKEFIISPEIFFVDEDKTIIPYIVNTPSVVFKTNLVDKLIQYQFEVQPAFELNTQR